MQYSYIDISSVINVDDWHVLDESLGGSRDKNIISHPETESLYIFKKPKKEREAQIWSELIASYIVGDLLKWPVQHAQIAIKNGEIGNLLQYIYDPSDNIFWHGEQFCKHVDKDFDPKEGRRHTWDLIKEIIFESDIPIQHVTIEEYWQFWSRASAFDTLISNTDRHAENWAVMADVIGKVENSQNNGIIVKNVRMAPFYDNASSMGCEVEETGLAKWFNEKGEIIGSKASSYLGKGCHHLRDGNERYKFEELAKIILSDFPTACNIFIEVAELDLSPIDNLLDQIMNIKNLPVNAKMTNRRALQIKKLLHEGQMRINRALNEI